MDENLEDLVEKKLKKDIFRSCLWNFSTKVGYIVNLNTSGKMSTEEAYKQIKKLWKSFKRTYKGGI